MPHEENEHSLIDLFLPLTNKKIIINIIIIGLLTYFNSLFNNFVGDDFGQVVYNAAIHSLSNIPLFFKISTFDLGNGISGIYYKPLLLTSYTIIYTLFGTNAFYFHFIQLTIYITNAVLLYLLLKRFITIQLSFILSVIFLVHPINQAVAGYIADLQDAQFFFFGMLALLVSLSGKIKYARIIVFLLLTLSLLSKETGVVFVLINLLYVFIFKRKQIVITLLLSSLLLICYGIAHYYAVGMQFAAPHYAHISRIPLLTRLITIPDIILFYFQTLLFPVSLSTNYDWVLNNITVINFYFPLLIDIVIISFFSAMTILIKKKDHTLFYPYLFFLVWFLISLGFHLQLIPLDATVSTSWFYLPFAGLLGMIGIIIQLYMNTKRSKIVFNFIVLVIIVLLLLLTIVRNSDFSNNLSLTCHDANVTNSFSLENSCGNSLAVEGHYKQAQKHLELSVQYAPYYYANWYSLGTVLAIEGSQTNNRVLINDSEKDIRESIAINPTMEEYYDILGYLYSNYNSTMHSTIFLKNATEKFPNDYKLWLYLAIVENKIGNKKAARNAAQKAYSLNATDPGVSSEYHKITN